MAYIIMNRGVDARREKLLGVFWADADPRSRPRQPQDGALAHQAVVVSAGAQADEFILATRSVVRWIADTSVDALEWIATLILRAVDVFAAATRPQNSMHESLLLHLRPCL
jgi:hypothetical protein